MRIEIKTKNFKLTPPLKTFTEERFFSLLPLFKDFEVKTELELRVELARTTKHHLKGEVYRAEASLELPKKLLYASVELSDLRLAIDEVKAKLQKQFASYKSKLNQKIHRLRRKAA